MREGVSHLSEGPPWYRKVFSSCYTLAEGRCGLAAAQVLADRPDHDIL